MYATVGASAHVIAGYDVDHRIEMFVGLAPAQDDVAKPLAMLVAEAVVSHVPLGHGSSVSFDEPLWDGTEMRAFLLLRPRAEIVPPLAVKDGPHVEFLQAIPLFASEIFYKTRHGAEGLVGAWEQAAVAFWDPARTLLPEFARVD